MATPLWAVRTTNHIASSSSPAQSMAVIEGTLMDCEFLPLPKDGHTLFHCGVVPRRCLRSCTVWKEINSIKILSRASSCYTVTQSATCKFTCMWVAHAWAALSSTCLCILSLVSATIGSWASAFPTIPMVTPSRMDLTASAFSFDITWLWASATTLSLPFWYLMLNVNPTSDSTQWCWMATKLEVVIMWVSGLWSVFTTNGFQCRYSLILNYAHEWSGTSLHMQHGGIAYKAVFVITPPPIPPCQHQFPRVMAFKSQQKLTQGPQDKLS